MKKNDIINTILFENNYKLINLFFPENETNYYFLLSLIKKINQSKEETFVISGNDLKNKIEAISADNISVLSNLKNVDEIFSFMTDACKDKKFKFFVIEEVAIDNNANVIKVKDFFSKIGRFVSYNDITIIVISKARKQYRENIDNYWEIASNTVSKITFSDIVIFTKNDNKCEDEVPKKKILKKIHDFLCFLYKILNKSFVSVKIVKDRYGFFNKNKFLFTVNRNNFNTKLFKPFFKKIN